MRIVVNRLDGSGRGGDLVIESPLLIRPFTLALSPEDGGEGTSNGLPTIEPVLVVQSPVARIGQVIQSAADHFTSILQQ